jgi:tight adherence protein B
MNVAHIAIFLSVFFVAMGIINALPGLIMAYRERYQVRARRTARELDKFFLNIKPGKILLIAAIIGALMGFLAGSWVVAGAIVVAGVFAPKIILSVWKEMRSAKFDAQLMDALLLMGNSLKSGLDIVAGIERVTTSMKPPVSEEFGLVLNAYRLGTPLESALMELTTRINSRNLDTVVYAINIQRETGGNIVRTFDQLVLTIREESKLQKKASAMTSQGRTQIFFLAGFPWALALLFYLISPDIMVPAFAHPMGQLIVVFLIVWEVIGISVTKKIVMVDV